MIRLVKNAKPFVLTLHSLNWTWQYIRRMGGDNSVPLAALTRYRHPQIKSALLAETHDKCAYCESKITHVAYGDVEHIRPKKHFPLLVVEWTNLTIACDRCNTNKDDYWDPATPLVDPYADPVEDLLQFNGPMVFAEFGSGAYLTVQRLKLNRVELMTRRADALEEIERLLALRGAQPPGGIRALLEDEIRVRTQPTAEFSAVASAFLRFRGVVI